MFLEEGREQDLRRLRDADALADQVLGLVDRGLGQRIEGEGVFLEADAETADRNVLGGGEHDGGARRHHAHLVLARRDHGEAIDVGPAGLQPEIDAFFLEIAHLLGHDLAKLIAVGKPAELHVQGLGALGGKDASGKYRRHGQRAGHRGPQFEHAATREPVSIHSIPPLAGRKPPSIPRLLRYSSDRCAPRLAAGRGRCRSWSHVTLVVAKCCQEA